MSKLITNTSVRPRKSGEELYEKIRAKYSRNSGVVPSIPADRWDPIAEDSTYMEINNHISRLEAFIIDIKLGNRKTSVDIIDEMHKVVYTGHSAGTSIPSAYNHAVSLMRKGRDPFAKVSKPSPLPVIVVNK